MAQWMVCLLGKQCKDLRAAPRDPGEKSGMKTQPVISMLG